MAALKGYGFFGGVCSSGSAKDQIALASLLHYLADQVLIMIRYAAMCPPETREKERHYKKAGALIIEKRKDLASYRGILTLMLNQENGAEAET